MKTINRRASLPHARRALAGGKLTVGFIGGSITESGSFRSYSDQVVNGIASAYPDAKIIFRNAGIGATNSTLGAFRVERDIVAAGCQLVFVEFAVNDYALEPAQRMAAREGMIRQLLRQGEADVVLVYTFRQEMCAEMLRGNMPATIAEFERLAERYRLSSVWMGLHALLQVQKGLLRWEEWLPDGLHPEAAGSRYYAEAALQFVLPELAGEGEEGAAFPAPLTAHPWERPRLLPLEGLDWKNPWKLRQANVNVGFREYLDTSAVGAELAFTFSGTALYAGLLTGLWGAALEYRVDGGPWQISDYERLPWMGNLGWFRGVMLAEGLERGPHRAVLRCRRSEDANARGTHLCVALLGVLE